MKGYKKKKIIEVAILTLAFSIITNSIFSSSAMADSTNLENYYSKIETIYESFKTNLLANLPPMQGGMGPSQNSSSQMSQGQKSKQQQMGQQQNTNQQTGSKQNQQQSQNNGTKSQNTNQQSNTNSQSQQSPTNTQQTPNQQQQNTSSNQSQQQAQSTTQNQQQSAQNSITQQSSASTPQKQEQTSTQTQQTAQLNQQSTQQNQQATQLNEQNQTPTQNTQTSQPQQEQQSQPKEQQTQPSTTQNQNTANPQTSTQTQQEQQQAQTKLGANDQKTPQQEPSQNHDTNVQQKNPEQSLNQNEPNQQEQQNSQENSRQFKQEIKNEPIQIKQEAFDQKIVESSFIGNVEEDGTPDWWKEQNFGSKETQIDTEMDSDSDGIKDTEEFKFGTKPNSINSDDDEYTDAEEILIFGFNPASFDTDGDGIADDKESEGEALTFNPKKADEDKKQNYMKENNIVLNEEKGEKLGLIDSDEDGISDEQELIYNSDPQNADSDGDGYSDGNEILIFDSNPNQESKIESVKISNIKKTEKNPAGPQFLMGASGEANQEVELYAIDEDGNETLIGTTTTDAEGKYAVLTEELEAGNYQISAVTKENGETTSVSYPSEMVISEETETKAPEFEVILSEEGLPKIEGNTEDQDVSLVITWQSLVFTSTIVADGNFEVEAPEGLEPGEHTATVYAVNNSDNSKSKPVEVKFTIPATTGFATGETNGMSPWITIGGASAILLSLITLVILKKRSKSDTIER